MGCPENICEDLVAEILCRLPPKDLLRARCVSKTWNRLVVHVCIPRILPDSRVRVGLAIAALIFELDTILSESSSYPDLKSTPEEF